MRPTRTDRKPSWTRRQPGAVARERITFIGALALGGMIVAIVAMAAGGGARSIVLLAAAGGVGIGAGAAWFMHTRARARIVADRRRLGRALDRVGRVLDPGSADQSALSQDPPLDRLDALASSLEGERSLPWRSPGGFGRFVDRLGEPIIATDNAGCVIVLNEAASGVLGLTRARAIGRPLHEILTHAQLADLARRERDGTQDRHRVRLLGPGGAGVYEALAEPWAGGVVLTLHDVTEAARTLELKTEFVANASHELRTPIAAILAAVDTLEDAEHDDAMAERLLGMVRTHATRLEALVGDLLDLARLESPDAATRIEPIDLPDLGRALTRDYEGVCRRGDVRLDFQISPEAATIRSDRRLVKLILSNLIDNAIRFSHAGESVRVTAEGNGDSGVRLAVIDRGIGIPLDDQERIFERFYQVDQTRDGSTPRRGTGLGLAIVKHAARTLGGSVRVESVWQEGTTMIVDLPGQGSPARPPITLPISAAAPPPSGVNPAVESGHRPDP